MYSYKLGLSPRVGPLPSTPCSAENVCLIVMQVRVDLPKDMVARARRRLTAAVCFSWRWRMFFFITSYCADRLVEDIAFI